MAFGCTVSSGTLRVAIVDANTTRAQALAQGIAASGLSCLEVFTEVERALAKLSSGDTDVVLLDVELPGIHGVTCVEQLKQLAPGLHAIVFGSEVESDSLFHALEGGADGYLLWDTPAEKVVDAVYEVHRGGAPMSGVIARRVVRSFRKNKRTESNLGALSKREKELLTLVAKGYQNKQIATEMGISTETVRVHLRNVYQKLEVSSRSEAVVKFLSR